MNEPAARRVELPGRGGEMAFLDFGPAERPVDVVFSHANGFNARTYRTVLAPLGELRILAVDLRGHGHSTLPATVEGWPGWTAYRDDLAAFLEVMTQRPVVLAGHSMGGTASLLAAAARPAQVRALALFDPVLLRGDILAARARGEPAGDDVSLEQGALRRRASFPDRDAAFSAYHGRGAFRTWSDDQLRDYVTDAFTEAAEGGVTLICTPAWEASNFRTHNYDPWAALAQIERPVRILRAASQSTAFVESRPDVMGRRAIRMETIPGTTHFLPLERPDLVQATLRELTV
jgi:pimeloyl-ACP methyl ester carboxylesterase